MLMSTHPHRLKGWTPTSHSSPPLPMTTTDVNGALPSNPSTWSVRQVEEWLLKCGFHDCVDILCRQYQIEGHRLINCDENEILHLTNNRQLWLEIKELREISVANCFHRSTPLPSPLANVSASQTSSPTVALLLEQTPMRSTSPHTPSDQIEDQLFTTCCLMSSIRSDRKKTFCAFLMALSTVYFCSFVITIVDERLPDPKSFPPLPDLILDNIRQIPWAFAVTEKLILIEILVMLVIILFHRHRWVQCDPTDTRFMRRCLEWSFFDVFLQSRRHSTFFEAWLWSSQPYRWQHAPLIVIRRWDVVFLREESVNGKRYAGGFLFLFSLEIRHVSRSLEDGRSDFRRPGHVLLWCQDLRWLLIQWPYLYSHLDDALHQRM